MSESIDEKRKILEAAGYRVGLATSASEWDEWGYASTPDGDWEFEDKSVPCHRQMGTILLNEAIGKAWQHYQDAQELARLRLLWQFAAMYIESPREVEMMAASIPQDKRQWFADEVEKKLRELKGDKAD